MDGPAGELAWPSLLLIHSGLLATPPSRPCDFTMKVRRSVNLTLGGGQVLFWFRPHVCRGYLGGALVTATHAGSGFDLDELLERSLASRTWSSRNDLWAGSIYFKGHCHLVFAKIVERRPQNSRQGLPRLTAASRA